MFTYISSEPSELVFDLATSKMLRKFHDFKSMIDQAITLIRKEVLGKCLARVPASTWMELQHLGDNAYDYMQM